MTLFELREAGLCVGGEGRLITGGRPKVLVRCGCLAWQWVIRSKLEFKVRRGHAWRCRACAVKWRPTPPGRKRSEPNTPETSP